IILLVCQVRMSEAEKSPDTLSQEQKKEEEMKCDMAQEKSTSDVGDIHVEHKKEDGVMTNTQEKDEANLLEKSKASGTNTEQVATPSVNLEEASTVKSDSGQVHGTGPSIKAEPSILSDGAGDSKVKEIQGDTVNELPSESTSGGSTVPVIAKDSTDEKTVVIIDKIPLVEKVESNIRTDAGDTNIESTKLDELKGKDALSSHVELSGSTTESLDTASSNQPLSSEEVRPAIDINNKLKTNELPISDVEKERLLTTEPEIAPENKKNADTTSDAQKTTPEIPVANKTDKMEIDNDPSSLTSVVSNCNLQKETTLQAQGKIQETNTPSDVSVQNSVVHHGEQKLETSLSHSYLPRKESAMANLHKMDVMPHEGTSSKAVHEIIAMNYGRLDTERIVPTSVSSDRLNLVHSSAPLVEGAPVSSSIQTTVPVPPEKDSLVSLPVNVEQSEPVFQPDLSVRAPGSVLTDSKIEVQESLDDWDIPASDEEEDDGESQTDGSEKKKRKIVKRGYWEPPIDVIVDLYNKLDKDGILELSWKCPGRRPPSEEGDKEEEKEQLEDIQDEEAMEISQEEDPTEFDFDMDVELDSSVQKMTPRRNIGGGQAQGSGKKRVARMDKVLNDIFRHRKIDTTTMVDPEKKENKESDQAMDTTTSPILTPNRPSDKFHIRSDL
ncbi:uncharacterized protein LOC121406991, partial [Lytechinus variegatus]|uniref:uncharacterized protein LOC121406991 n=1 Tax=Lytechinus variegatus TaxID=7654 RepID=UPI001BB1D678